MDELSDKKWIVEDYVGRFIDEPIIVYGGRCVDGNYVNTSILLVKTII